jgi:hypothetical protein
LSVSPYPARPPGIPLPPKQTLLTHLPLSRPFSPVVTHMRTTDTSFPLQLVPAIPACHQRLLHLSDPPRQPPGSIFSLPPAARPWSPPMGDDRAGPSMATSPTSRPLSGGHNLLPGHV